MLQPCSTYRLVDEPIHMVMQQYMDTLCATQRQTNLTTSLLQDIHTFHGQDTTKLQDWLRDIETAVDIFLGELCMPGQGQITQTDPHPCF